MTPIVRGIGTAVPPLRIDAAESVEAARVLCTEDEDQAPLLEALYRQSGVRSRHIVHSLQEFRRVVHGEGECDTVWVSQGRGDRGPTTAQRMERYELEAIPLAERACRVALDQAGEAPRRITHLVTVSCTGFAAPGVDIALIKRLGMPCDVERTHVGFMGCHGALNGLRVARGLLAAEPAARVLLCAVELCSLHYAYGWDPKKVVGNALFADGAAAAVLGNATADGAGADAWRLEASGACLFPDCESAMAWRVRDHGFEMVLSTRVPNLIQRHLRPWLESWLAKRRVTIDGVASWAVHPGGPRVLTCVQEALGLPAGATEASRAVLESYGNMSSATVLFILKSLMAERAPRPCVAIGFGPGLAAEAALLG